MITGIVTTVKLQFYYSLLKPLVNRLGDDLKLMTLNSFFIQHFYLLATYSR